MAGGVLILMVVLFLAITLWAYSTSNRERFEAAAQIPWLDERTHETCCRALDQLRNETDKPA